METVAADANGRQNITIDCDYDMSEDVCLDLYVDYTEIASTNDYNYESIAFNPEIPFDQGTALTPSLPLVDGAVDDKFSEAIPLGFSFCFYDQNFSNIVIGTNGILTFDLDEAGADCPSGISVTNPNPALIDNAIFGVQHDMVFEQNDPSEIYYSTIGTAPCRKFVVNYYNAKIFGCDTRSTIQVVLSEFTNEIEVHILEKQEHCPNGRDGSALLGIMNADGTQGISPPGRNTSEWETANESWRFFPTGNIPPNIVWLDELGNEVGTGNPISVCPNRNTTYTVQVQYQSCQGNDLFGTDNIRVTFDQEFPAVENETVFVCDSGNDGSEMITFADYSSWIALNNIANFNISYYSSLINAQNQSSPITTTELLSDTIFYIRMENAANPGCYTITPITFTFSSAEIGNLRIQLCDNNNDNLETDVDLVPFIENILSDVTYVSYSIHNTQQEANNQSNPITIANLRRNSQFWIYLQVSEECTQVLGPVTVRFLNAPPNRANGTVQFTSCDINYNHYEPFDWSTEVPNSININSGETFTVHNTYADAENGIRPQSQISDNIEVYYVRVENASGCFSIFEIIPTVEFWGVEASAYEANICFDGVEDITINLNDYPSLMLVDPTTGVDISIYSNTEDANNHAVENIIDPIQTITDDGYLVQAVFYVRFQISEDCYTVRQITIRLVHPEPMQDPIDVCDIFNDNNEDENALFIYDQYILGDQVGTVQYFTNESDALSNSNEIFNYEFVGNQTLYVRITSYDCSEVYPIEFNLVSVPPSQNITMDLGEVCDVNGNGLTELNLTAFESEVYAGSDPVTFLYYLNYNPSTEELTNPIETPELFPVTGDLVFYIQMFDANANCNAIAEVNLGIDFSQTFEINAAELYVCDFQFDLNETFYLSDAFSQITTGIENFNPNLYNIQYFTSLEDLENNVNAIEGNEFTPNSAAYPIYVSFTNLITGCVATNILTLNTVGAPKPQDGFKEVCDTNLNGLYDLDLNLLDIEVMDGGSTEGLVFTYYLTEQDARDEINALDDSDYYEADPFPTLIWVRVERANIEDCHDVKNVTISFTPLTELNISNLDTYGCDLENNGNAVFDLTFVESIFPPNQFVLAYYENLEQIHNREPEIANPNVYENSSPYQNTVVAMVEEIGFCPTYVTINLDYATIELTVNTEPFCPGDAIDIVPQQANASDNFGYEWVNQSGEIISTDAILTNVTEATTYTLTVTNLDYPLCSKIFEVETTHYEPPVILDIVEDGNTITVLASGLYPIQYSMDGVNWQGLNYFTDLEAGYEYVFYVRYIEQGCLGEPYSGTIFMIPNVITPNGDGYNDEIIIENLHVFDGQNSTFQVYDRYGKLIFEETSNTEIIWDGKYLGRVLNSTDYYYIFKIPDGREIKGHITVKNY